jgi:predicted nucleic acid-binding protein
MTLMKDNLFVDSTIFLYLLSNDEVKKNIAKTILDAHPVISTQVISGNINVIFKKFKMLNIVQISQHANILLNYAA